MNNSDEQSGIVKFTVFGGVVNNLFRMVHGLTRLIFLMDYTLVHLHA
jgi:hypothetical protein